MSKRAVSAHTKDEVFWRDGATCRLCKDELGDLRWQCDHIVPLWDGGSNGMENLQALCANCHSEKTILEARDRAKRAKLQEETRRLEEAAARTALYGVDLERFRYEPDAEPATDLGSFREHGDTSNGVGPLHEI